ncbi:MAG: hypothetical protein Q4P26_01525 [Lachnospiraceae bacterium]|nr:hypothetical protein [Lachnospiraceae bacterium]
MKNQKMKETLRQISKKAGALVLATAIVLGGGTYVYNQQNPVPELVTYIDEDSVVQIQEDETPLASPQVTKSTKTTKSTKKISLKSAASKTYAQKGKTTTKKKTTKIKSAQKTVTTETVTVTSITNNYKKGSKINTQVTTVKTTVTKTTVTNTAKPVTTPVTNGTVAVTQIAPAADKRVLNAFQKLGFQVVIQSNVPYSGLFAADKATITLKEADAGVAYHELGHFLAFIAGNVDRSSAFQQIFQNEKSKYTAYDKGYVLQNSEEYFAQSFRDYTENPAALKASRPQTYAAIQQALSRVTDAQIANVLRIYGARWGN